MLYSRNQSPSRAGDSATNSPVSGAQTPVEASLSPTSPPAIDEDKMRKKTKSTIEEFFGVLDYKVCSLKLSLKSTINFQVNFFSCEQQRSWTASIFLKVVKVTFGLLNRRSQHYLKLTSIQFLFSFV